MGVTVTEAVIHALEDTVRASAEEAMPVSASPPQRPWRAAFHYTDGQSLVYPRGLPYDGIVKRARTLYIKNPAAHRLAEQLAKQMGVTLTEAVIRALENQVHPSPKPIDRKKLDAICAEIAALTVLDPRSPDEIIGYDEFGLPR